MAARSSSSSTRARMTSRRGDPDPNPKPDANPDTNSNTSPNTNTNPTLTPTRTLALTLTLTLTRYSSLIVATTQNIMAYQVVEVRAAPRPRPLSLPSRSPSDSPWTTLRPPSGRPPSPCPQTAATLTRAVLSTCWYTPPTACSPWHHAGVSRPAETARHFKTRSKRQDQKVAG